MPLGRYVEKYELNGKTGLHSYGSISSGDAESQVMLPKTKDVDESSESEVHGLAPSENIIESLVEDSIRFRDGKRKIDYILVFEESSQTRSGKSVAYRDKYINNIRLSGLEIEEEIVPLRSASVDKHQSGDKFLHFVKLYAPFPVLCNYAEQLSFRSPLQSLPNESDNWTDSLFRFLSVKNPMYEFVPNKPLDYYTCPFKKSKLDRFLGSDEKEDFFTTTERIRVVHQILQTTAFGKRSLAQIGIDRLIEQQIFIASFPLHDGQYECPNHMTEAQHYNKRQILYHYWAQWSKWYKYQPLDHIREYFGEKIAIYFAWLGFYTGWLVPASIVGILVFLYGLFSINSDKPSREVCSSGDKFLMCPTCDETQGCQYWHLSEICLYSRLSVMFDHSGTVFYAIFISFWAVAFLEYWKRKSASLAHHWDTIDCEEEERPRPHFSARAPYLERNPITGHKEPSFPHRIRCLRMTAGYMTIILMLMLVLIFMLAVIIYRIILVSTHSFQTQEVRPIASLIATSSGAFVNLIFIMLLGRVYEKLAYRLTEWEMHRTQSEFDNQLAFKVFLFQFFNFYSSIFYIAFFKGRFVGRPGNYGKLLGLRNEDCSNYGCLMELTQQLAIIMIGKQVINNCREIFLPKLQSWYHRKQTNIEHRNRGLTRWEQDFRLIPYEGLFEEYLEMILQFGFITIFVAAFPLAPFFALINNWFEIRLDAHKLVCHTKRPIPERARNIGVWFSILNFLSHFAVISNAFLIAFTSDFLPKLLYHYEFGSNNDYDSSLSGYINYTLAVSPNGTMNQTCRYRDFRDPEGHRTIFYWKLMFVRLAFIVVFEHLVFSICRLIDLLVPDIPKTVEHKIKRERYLGKQALTDSDEVMKVNALLSDDQNEEVLDET